MNDPFVHSLPTTMRGWFLWWAFRLLWVPYIWGGNDPQRDGGLDCSGFIGFYGRMCGWLPEVYDDTAAGYYRMLARNGNSLQDLPDTPGALVFFSRSDKVGDIKHVGIIVAPGLMIDAGRGDSTLTPSTGDPLAAVIERAKKRGAHVSVRPVDHHDMKNRFYADPFLGSD